MKTAQGVFLASRVVLGTSHVLFQSLADLTIKAEKAVVSKTGYWEDNKQYILDDKQLGEYANARREHTRKTQAMMSSKYKAISKMIDDKKKLVTSK